jgi:hypothetical protein
MNNRPDPAALPRVEDPRVEDPQKPKRQYPKNDGIRFKLRPILSSSKLHHYRMNRLLEPRNLTRLILICLSILASEDSVFRVPLQ